MEFEFVYDESTGLPTSGNLMGNGKLGIINSADPSLIKVDRAVISRNVNYKNGQYQSNTIDMFVPFGIEMFAIDDMCMTSVKNTGQRLNMNTGIATNSYEIRRYGESGGSVGGSNLTEPVNTVNFDGFGAFVVGAGGSELNVSLEPLVIDCDVSTYCVRHLPYCTAQTINCSNVNKSSVRLVHDCWTQENLFEVAYENSTRYVSPEYPLHIFSGSGKTIDGLRVAFASAYLIDDSTGIKVLPRGAGTNIASSLRNFHFNCLDVTNITSPNFTVHIFTAFVTSDDFDDPKNEVLRIITSCCSPTHVAFTQQQVATYIRGKHVDAWGKLWDTKVRISPKIDASPEQESEVKELNKCLYSALYHIYSCVRENFMNDTNTDAIPMLDIDGSMIYECDLWLIPLLLVVKPDIARSLIEYRIASLPLAKQLAASYGFEGGKIPYIDDIIGFKNNLYYNTSSYIHVFNTCMAAINAWNYYRVSRDKNWLRVKGFQILQSVADYVCSILQKDTDTGEVTLINVVGLTSRVSESDNSFTINLIKLALKYATESTYELKYNLPEQWSECLDGLAFPIYDVTAIIKVDGQSTETDSFNVLEVLHTMTPGAWENMDRSNSVQFADFVKRHAMFYDGNKIIEGDSFRPMNIALQAITSGVIMSSDAAYLSTYMSHVQDFIRENVAGPWKQMKKDIRFINRRVEGLPFAQGNSLTTNALFLQMIIQGIMQVRIIGGISGLRFYYEEMKIASVNYATMPTYWNHISLTNFGIGNNKRTIDTRQNPYDLLANPPSVGGAFIQFGDFTAFTP